MPRPRKSSAEQESGSFAAPIHSAIEIGRLVPGGEWRAKLHSIFPRFINIEHEAGYLLSITTDHNSMYGYAILVSENCFDQCRKSLTNTPDAIDFSASYFGIGGERHINCRKGATYSGTIEACGMNIPSKETVQALESFAKSDESAGADVFRRRIGEVLERAAGEYCRTRSTDTPTEVHESAPDLSPIIGVGKGLTPAGDDIIVGALLVESLYPQSVSIKHDTIATNLSRTNLPGRTLLRAVLAGAYPTHAKRFAHAICSGNENLVERGIRETLTYGGSSGRDLCLGVAWCLSLCVD